MANFFRYHWEVICRASKDTSLDVNKILSACSLPETSVLKVTIFSAFAIGVITYLITGGLAWNEEELRKAAISSLSALILALLLFCRNLLMAPSRIDKEKREIISTLTSQITIKALSKESYDKLVKYRGNIVDEFMNHVFPFDKTDPNYIKLYHKLATVKTEIAEHITNHFSAYHGARIMHLGELPLKCADYIKNIAAEINVRIEEVLKIHDKPPVNQG